MAGLFDNFGPNVAGGLSGFGGVLGGIGRGLAGAQNYSALSQAMGPQAALMAQTNPQAFQTMIFMQQLNDWQQRNPGKSINEALYQISPKGQEETYGRPPGTVSVEGAQVPAYMVQQPGGGVQAQPSQQPQPQQPQGVAGQMQKIIAPLQDLGIAGKARAAGAEETARKQADALQQYPNALITAQDAVARLQAHRDNPNLGTIVGGTLGIKGRAGVIGQTQADLVNESNELQGKIIGNTLNASRSVSGRPVTPGALKDLTVGAGDLIAGRKGTLEGYKNTINNSIDIIKKETQAAWEATGKKGDAPSWGAPSPKTAPPAAAIAHLKANPQLRSQFDAKYGNGASAAFVGQ